MSCGAHCSRGVCCRTLTQRSRRSRPVLLWLRCLCRNQKFKNNQNYLPNCSTGDFACSLSLLSHAHFSLAPLCLSDSYSTACFPIDSYIVLSTCTTVALVFLGRHCFHCVYSVFKTEREETASSMEITGLFFFSKGTSLFVKWTNWRQTAETEKASSLFCLWDFF